MFPLTTSIIAYLESHIFFNKGFLAFREMYIILNLHFIWMK